METPLKTRESLLANGVKLVVAIFDNSFWWGGIFSRDMMLKFYNAFLVWVLEDPDIAIITKSKKPTILYDLPELASLMEQAISKGRWVNIPDVVGRVPSDASCSADISVGIGISSAVTEAVAAGCRGVHCDLKGIYDHPFYEWGYEKVIFDDLDKMLGSSG